MMELRRTRHCWADKAEHVAKEHGEYSPQHIDTMYGPSGNATCMLEDGHDGPHDWTSDSEIVVEFTDPRTPATAGDERKDG
jgi:hypothetical protein